MLLIQRDDKYLKCANFHRHFHVWNWNVLEWSCRSEQSYWSLFTPWSCGKFFIFLPDSISFYYQSCPAFCSIENSHNVVRTGYETSHMIFILLIAHMLLTCAPRSAAPSRDISFLGSPALSSPAPFAPPHNAGAPQLPSSSPPPSLSPPPSEQNKHFICSIISQYSDKRHQKMKFVKGKLPFAPCPPWPVPKTPPC